MNISERGRCLNKPIILRAIGANGNKNWEPLFFQVQIDVYFFIFEILLINFFCHFYASGIDMSQHFQGPFGPLVRTFCRPSPNFRAISPRACLISTHGKGKMSTIRNNTVFYTLHYHYLHHTSCIEHNDYSNPGKVFSIFFSKI